MTPNEYIEVSKKVLHILYPNDLIPLKCVIGFMEETRNCAARIAREGGLKFNNRPVQEVGCLIAESIWPSNLPGDCKT